RRFDDDDKGDDEVIRDGQSVRRRLLAMDARAGAVDCGPGGPHRPGFRYASDEQRAAADRAHEKMVAEATDAWRPPARRESDMEAACEQARIEVMCRDDIQRAQRVRDEAYLSMVRRAEQAWRQRP